MSNIIPGCLCMIINGEENVGRFVTAVSFYGACDRDGSADLWMVDAPWAGIDKRGPGGHCYSSESNLKRIDDYQPTEEELEDLLTDISDVIKVKE